METMMEWVFFTLLIFCWTYAAFEFGRFVEAFTAWLKEEEAKRKKAA